jgi:hypothetical protein
MGPIAGKLLDNTDGISYLTMQLFTGVFLSVASVLYLLTRFIVPRTDIA